MNPLHPRHLKPAERRSELCRILARGVLRLKRAQSSEVSATAGESSLHFPPDRSGHATPYTERDAA